MSQNITVPLPARLVPFEQRRRSERKELAADAQVLDDLRPSRLTAMWVRVFNISNEGIGFHSDSPLAIGTTHRLQLSTRMLSLNTRLRVVRCDVRGHEFELGAEFVDE